jgi:hypothetical protein
MRLAWIDPERSFWATRRRFRLPGFSRPQARKSRRRITAAAAVEISRETEIRMQSADLALIMETESTIVIRPGGSAGGERIAQDLTGRSPFSSINFIAAIAPRASGRTRFSSLLLNASTR